MPIVDALEPETRKVQMMENNKVILEKANAAIYLGDHEGFLAYCTDDTEWTFVG